MHKFHRLVQTQHVADVGHMNRQALGLAGRLRCAPCIKENMLLGGSAVTTLLYVLSQSSVTPILGATSYTRPSTKIDWNPRGHNNDWHTQDPLFI